MSDEELANVLVGRHERLSEEANAALSEVMANKDPVAFAQEVEHKVEDLNAQARAAAAEVQRQIEHSKRSRRALLVFFITVAVILAAVAAMRGA